MEKGIIRSHDADVPITIEIVCNEIVIHYPKDYDTKNWYHAVRIETDIEVIDIYGKCIYQNGEYCKTYFEEKLYCEYCVNGKCDRFI